MDIQKYLEALAYQKADEMRPFFNSDAVIYWHNTNEKFNSEEFIKVNCAYPGDFDFETKRIIELENLFIIVIRIFSLDGSISLHACSFIRLLNGKISQIDEYFSDDTEAPAWRKNMNLGDRIK